MDDAVKVNNPLVVARGGLASITANASGLGAQGLSSLSESTSALPFVAVTHTPNPLLSAVRHFVVECGPGGKKIKVTSSARAKLVLMSEIRRHLGLVNDFSLLLFDPDVEDWVEWERWTDLPIGKAKLRVIEQQSVNPTLLSKRDIDHETSNELVFWHENKTERRIRMHLHPMNFGRMRSRASHQWCPVVSFLGPTGGGKSSLICKFKPKVKPVVALDAQPIPTTSNINSFVVQGEDVAPSVQTAEIPNVAKFDAQRALADLASHSTFPYMRLLDVEGEDGGLPLMEYCKSEGGGLEDIELSSTDVVEFVRKLFEKCDRDDLNSYMDTRKNVTKKYFPRLAYLMSDVIVYVNTVPPKRESQYLDRIREFAEYSHKGVTSAERPSLIMVYNQCRRTEVPFDIDESTEHFFLLVDREKELLESFRTVDFVKIPDWEHESLYKAQLDGFRERLLLRIIEQRSARQVAGTLFSDVVWFSVLDKVLEFFEDEAISMSKIFARFIISESSLVNRAYNFFDHIYARQNSKAVFIQCRRATLRMLAAYIVLQHHGDSSVLDNDDTYNKLLDQLLDRIRRRTPCEKKHRGNRCAEELSLHDAHRFYMSKSAETGSGSDLVEVRGPHAFEDTESRDDLFEVLSTMARTLPSPADEPAKFYRALRELFGEGIRVGSGFSLESKSLEHTISSSSTASLVEAGQSKAEPGSFEDAVAEDPKLALSQLKVPQERCFVCFKNRHDVMLSCRHEFCSECVNGFIISEQEARTAEQEASLHAQKQSSPRRTHTARFVTRKATQVAAAELFACPLCNLRTAAVPNAPSLVGNGGVRILSLDGGGFRAIMHVKMLQRICEIAELNVHDMFDFIIGTGLSGPVALALSKRLELEKLHDTFAELPRNLKRRPLLQNVMGRRLFQFLFGSTFSSNAFESEMRTLFGERADLLQQVMHNHMPKVALVTGDASGLVETRLLANYPQGRREDPKLDCDMMLWQAARASAAIPDVFDAYTAPNGRSYVDGSMFGLNPALISVNEAQRAWKYECGIDIVVSLGTGLRSSRNPKSENFLRFLNETLDLGQLAARIEADMHTVMGEDTYMRLNPEIPMSGRETTTNESALKSVMRATDLWIGRNRDLFVEAAIRLKAKSFVVGAKYLAYAGTTYNFDILCRLRDQVAIRDPTFHIVFEDHEAKPLETKLRKSTRNLSAELKHTEKWTVAIRPRKVGTFRLSVFASFPDDVEGHALKVHIGGSPMMLEVRPAEEGTDAVHGVPSARTLPIPVDIPPSRHLPFAEFLNLTTISKSGPVQEAEEDGEVLAEHRDEAQVRLNRCGLLPPPLLQLRRHDPDCLFRACADFLFGSADKHLFVRQSVAGWLRHHGDARMWDGSRVCEHLRQGESWDDYCSAIERNTTWGDALTLHAIAQHFGCRIVVVSSCAGTRYITQTVPYVSKRGDLMLLVQWAKFGWALLRPWSATQPFKPEPKSLVDSRVRLAGGANLASSPRGMEFKTDRDFAIEPEVVQSSDKQDNTVSSEVLFDQHDVNDKDPFVRALQAAARGWPVEGDGESDTTNKRNICQVANLSGVMLPVFTPFAEAPEIVHDCTEHLRRSAVQLPALPSVFSMSDSSAVTNDSGDDNDVVPLYTMHNSNGHNIHTDHGSDDTEKDVRSSSPDATVKPQSPVSLHEIPAAGYVVPDADGQHTTMITTIDEDVRIAAPAPSKALHVAFLDLPAQQILPDTTVPTTASLGSSSQLSQSNGLKQVASAPDSLPIYDSKSNNDKRESGERSKQEAALDLPVEPKTKTVPDSSVSRFPRQLRPVEALDVVNRNVIEASDTWNRVVAGLQRDAGPEAKLVTIEWKNCTSSDSEVSLAGDFTDWRDIAVTSQIWSVGSLPTFGVKLPLRSGETYKYRFTIDGKIVFDQTCPGGFDPNGALVNKISVPK